MSVVIVVAEAPAVGVMSRGGARGASVKKNRRGKQGNMRNTQHVRKKEVELV